MSLAGPLAKYQSTQRVSPCGPAGRLKARMDGRGQLQEYRLKGKTNLSSRDIRSSCPLFVGTFGTVLTVAVLTAAALNSAVLRSSAAIVCTLARISSVGSTQSMGIELHFSVGQLSRSGPLPRVPPVTWMCRPDMSLPQ